MNSLLKSRNYLRVVLMNKIFSMRMLICVMILFIFHDYLVRDLVQLSKIYDVGLTPMVFPFLTGNYEFQFVFGLLAVFLFADVPFFEKWEMPYMNRMGRLWWVSLHCISICIISAVYIGINYLIDLIRIGVHVDFHNDWDRVIFSLANTDLSEQSTVYVSKAFVNAYTPIQAFFVTFCFGVFAITIIGFIMFACSIAINRLTAICVGIVLCVMPFVALTGKSSGYKCFQYLYYASPLSWITGDKPAYVGHYPNRVQMVMAGTAGIVISIVVIYVFVKKKDVLWNMEE